MLISNAVSSQSWSQAFRMVRIGLDAGLPIVRVFRQQADRGPLAVRPLMARLADRLAAGDTLADALAPEKDQLPPLVPPLLAVGEEAGRIGEALRELEEFFERQHQFKRNFISQIAWPVFQLGSAVGVIALFLLILGFLNIPMKPLGSWIGTGPAGALRWLLCVGGVGLSAFAFIRYFTRRGRFAAPVERTFLALPGIGSAMQSLLLGRMCLGLKLTLGSGLPVKRAVRLSTEGTGSRTFAAAFERAKPALARGATLTETLQACRIFPRDFLDAVSVGEESGNLPELMGKQAEMYREEATMRLKMLTQAGGWFVYALVAVLIIIMIFRIYTTAILPAYNI
jgi:type II secretory pathway component PulF